jgi:hypothetical protein
MVPYLDGQECLTVLDTLFKSDISSENRLKML